MTARKKSHCEICGDYLHSFMTVAIAGHEFCNDCYSDYVFPEVEAAIIVAIADGKLAIHNEQRGKGGI